MSRQERVKCKNIPYGNSLSQTMADNNYIQLQKNQHEQCISLHNSSRDKWAMQIMHHRCIVQVDNGSISGKLRWHILHIFTQRNLNTEENKISQQTWNHFWTSWHVSYWLVIGTAPPARVFTWMHMFCLLSWVLNEFDTSRTGSELVRVITWKTRDSTVNMCRHTKFVDRIQWIHVRKYVNWASWTHEFTYRTCKITGRCLLGWACYCLQQSMVQKPGYYNLKRQGIFNLYRYIPYDLLNFYKGWQMAK